MKLNDFGPLQSDVWGNVSEWAMVAVTTTTLCFIVRTLNSQQEIQKMEAENQRHSQRQYLRSMLPVIPLLPGTSGASTLRDFTVIGKYKYTEIGNRNAQKMATRMHKKAGE